ncbi:Abscission/NoCut checkpoint regulator [Tolypocladium capitatum]|uniref:Abscission/NoCut checkpoint regulator n=1 Tax=Tolypocladium capitatum TaxID=45235 RepID=A0A2K3QDM6_9HYPO|nr:Abscission/NoCut checkpoint regulator [Tolypocladium capitatum]
MAALRAPTAASSRSVLPSSRSVLPSVPTSKPAGEPVRRLASKTAYADDDVDSWCTVCLEDAALRCLGCDDDPYCARCWREMHVGPAAGFDERGHRAVRFTRSGKKEDAPRVALGAS